MKKIIIVLLMAFGLVQTTKAQGNLQFNKVINIEFTKKLTARVVGYVNSQNVLFYNNPDTTVTVPAGKIWKIEAIRLGTSQDSTSYNPAKLVSYGQLNCVATLDGTMLSTTSANWYAGSAASSVAADVTGQNLFLAPDTYKLGLILSANAGGGLAIGCTGRAFFSIIEYNVVP
jgi:hypothetical protein